MQLVPLATPPLQGQDLTAYRESTAAPFLTTSITEFDRIRNMAYLTIKVRAGILKITKGAAGRRSAPKIVERSNRTCRSVGGYFFFVPKIRSMSTSITTSITRYSIEPPPCRGKT